MENNMNYQQSEYHIEYFDKNELKPDLNNKGDVMLISNVEEQKSGYYVWDGSKWVGLMTWDSD